MSGKIQASQLERRAAVYLRQSSLKQLVDHRESTARQYRLRERAVELGWPPERVDVIDSDLGLSGSSTEGRLGFQGLAESVAHGRVGAIFALEVSRLARCSADWHRLLDLCGLADVVIADEQAVYAPRNHDDRLLLGLKGTMSEAEQYWMRLRLQGGALNKARRGDLYRRPPTGYEWDAEKSRLVLYPDDEVQQAVRLVFERFRIDGSAGAVLRYFSRHGLLLPTRDSGLGEIAWRPPRHALIINMLHNPAYAGAYVFGGRESKLGLVNGEVRRCEVRWLPQESWKVCLREHHPGYIGWNEFMENRKKLEANRANHQIPAERGAAREGDALLQGLVRCGRCGHRMNTYYHTRKGKGGARYRCRALNRRLGRSGECWTLGAGAVDDAVVERFLEAAAPAGIDLSLAVANETERQVREVAEQWERRLDRARYEARHAERRYKAVDPDNRNVARTLEKEWNEKLSDLERLQTEKLQAEQELHLNLTDDDKRKIRRLARDLPSVWAAPTTTPTERKNLLRLAIQEITLLPVDVPTRATCVKILWKSGAVEEFIVDRAERPVTGSTDEMPLEKIGAVMASGLTDQQIADALNEEKVPAGSGRPWTKKAVERFRGRKGLKKYTTTGYRRPSRALGSGANSPRKG